MKLRSILRVLSLLAFIVIYFVVVRWVLPRLGVPT